MPIHPILDAMYGGETLVFGHRGARAYAPMNTLPSFELAAAQGAHGIELDVHRSKDGFPVIVHDFTVDATSDGTGRVCDMTLAELKALDAGSYFAPDFAGTRVPTLDEVFEAVGRRLFVNVEIKSVSLETDGVEAVVADCIRRHGMTERVIISSFNPFSLLRFRAILPEAPIGFLRAANYLPAEVDAIMAAHPYDAFHPYHADITAEMVAQHRAAGRLLNTWTVNEPARAVALRDLGVRGIITDKPDLIGAALRG
ncbi:MAG: glycerophosphodiester phosphodiesterase [Anaerolineae bacterium]|nr:glycerophosphodiester phosphodiesterase [Anaerolineae bacterium]